MVLAVLLVLLLVVPVVEFWVIVEISARIGALPTLLVLILVSVLGVWTVRRVGIGVWRRARAASAQGRVPAAEVLDGTVVLVAGALLVVPGFVTDLVGFVLLAPPVRRLVAGLATIRLRRMMPTGVRKARTVRVASTWSSDRPDEVEGQTVPKSRELGP